MSKSDIERLRAIKTLPSLIAYLRDDLGWPIEQGMVEEDITFNYSAEELGIAPGQAVGIKEIKQLRPMDANQPWGIFWINFEKKRLPVVMLRRILGHLVLKKRASARKSTQRAWQLNDLLFISAYGEVTDRAITFAHFAEDMNSPGDLPVLKVLGWDGGDTVLHLADAHNTLVDRLRWPDNPLDINTWRERWSRAFVVRHGEVISTTQDLVEELAQLAMAVRKKAGTILVRESGRGPMRKLYSAFKTALIHDLTEDDFADVIAQTISYGLLAARFSRPSGISVQNLVDMIPSTNPFLRELLGEFLSIAGRKKGAFDFDELGIQDVVEVLNTANPEAVKSDFGNRTRNEDPVIYFYEHFLHIYDKKKKVQRGVFFTPQPVVSYIVRSVHELLQTEFGLEDGLADTTTWGEMVKRNNDLKIPEGAKPGDPFVLLLDPATGTATFLVEVIEIIFTHLEKKWKSQGKRNGAITQLWNEYVPKHLFPRLYGYELMMAPYTIAHMKLGLKLLEINTRLGQPSYQFKIEGRAHIYLTNSLEPAGDDNQGVLEGIFPALAHEAAAVNRVKKEKRFTVVIGNPPYSVSSWNKGKWITDLVEDYKRTVRQEESQIQSLSNDYIKFLRFAQWHIETTGVGTIGFITGHGYLQGTQPRDLRNHLSGTLDRCYCLDLHGSLRRVGTDDAEDEPVFEIMTGVAILVAVRAVAHRQRGLTSLQSLTGRLTTKFDFLRSQTVPTLGTSGRLYEPTAPLFLFAASQSGQGVEEEFRGYFDLPAIYGTGNRKTDKETFWATGFTSQQDELAVAFTHDEIGHNMRALAESKSFEDLRKGFRLCTTDQWNYADAKQFAQSGLWKENCGQVLYRPFDRRWTVLHRHVLTILRNQVMRQLDGKPERNLALISSRAVNDLVFAHCFVTTERVDRTFISSKTSTNAYVFPLFFSDDDLLGGTPHLNLSRGFLATLAAHLKKKQEGLHGTPDGLPPEDIFHYIYAVLHSPTYRTRYAEFLKIDFPRLPLTSSFDLFRALAKLGGELVALHLMESPKLDKHITQWTGGNSPEVEKVTYSDETVWIDKAQSEGFRGVPGNVWNFHIGGYQVCNKWLKDRKWRTLSKEDIDHYQKIVVALNETIRIMAEIDEVIDAHGGWPGAFKTN